MEKKSEVGLLNEIRDLWVEMLLEKIVNWNLYQYLHDPIYSKPIVSKISTKSFLKFELHKPKYSFNGKAWIQFLVKMDLSRKIS